MIVQGIDRVERTVTETHEGTYEEKRVVLDYDRNDPNKSPVAVTLNDVTYVVTSITSEDFSDDRGITYTVKGRKVRKDGKGYRSQYSDYLGYLRLDFLGGELS